MFQVLADCARVNWEGNVFFNPDVRDANSVVRAYGQTNWSQLLGSIDGDKRIVNMKIFRKPLDALGTIYDAAFLFTHLRYYKQMTILITLLRSTQTTGRTSVHGTI